MGEDIGMVQCGCGLGFALEAAECLRVAGNFLGQKFQGDETLQAGVFGFVDDAHTSAVDAFDDVVMGNGVADERRSFGHGTRF